MLQEQDDQRPLLKDLVAEASRALARLDADRLEELALSCQALNRDLGEGILSDCDLSHPNATSRTGMAAEAKDAQKEMAVLGRVLEGTRANLNLMKRLSQLRGGVLEYRAPEAGKWTQSESGYGDN